MAVNAVGRPLGMYAAVTDERLVKLTFELSASLHGDLVAYGEVSGREARQGAIEPGG